MEELVENLEVVKCLEISRAKAYPIVKPKTLRLLDTLLRSLLLCDTFQTPRQSEWLSPVHAPPTVLLPTCTEHSAHLFMSI